jgi:hypothetical protein
MLTAPSNANAGAAGSSELIPSRGYRKTRGLSCFDITMSGMRESGESSGTAADFFVVPTATGRLLFVLIILAHERRRVVHVAVTDHPTAASLVLLT